MTDSTDRELGPDLTHGIDAGELKEGRPLRGHVDGAPALLVRQNGRIFAIGAECTHYGGALDDGLVTEGAIHCPLHHACFDLETGAAHAPAVEPVTCYDVEISDGVVRVTGERERETPRTAAGTTAGPIVIIGAGAAGSACAEELRRNGFLGDITLIANTTPFPVDRPNLSKDFLAGDAPEAWLPIHERAFYHEHNITWIAEPATRIDRARREVILESDARVPYQMLLLATGSRARTLPIPGADLDHVHTLRGLADARQLKNAAEDATTAVVIGAGFIGLEVAAALRKHNLDVTIVAPDTEPLEGVLGERVGAVLRKKYLLHGVQFQLEHTPTRIDTDSVELDDGSRIPADLVILGVGAEPRLELAEDAGLEVEDGIIVTSELRTSDPVIFAAGDIALFPYDGKRARIEHWATAQRHGQCVARTMVGKPTSYTDVPFFWSQHPDLTIRVVGHAADWDKALITGDLEACEATVSYWKDGEVKAVATFCQPQVSLRAETLLARGDQKALAELVTGISTPSHAEPAPQTFA